MNKPFYNPENIESYIANKMSASDKAFFESELAKDPLLSNEISLQKDIAESLKAYRKAELKGRLNNIEVSIGSSYTGVKVAASVILASLISFGSYYYFSKNDSVADKLEVNSIASNNTNSALKNNNTSEVAVKSEAIEQTKIDATEPTKNKISKKDDVVIVDKSKKKKTTSTSPAIKNEEPVTLPAVNPQDVKDKFEDNDKFQNDNEIQMPKGDVGTTTHLNNVKDLHVEVKNTKKQFHYQYYNDKLFLYGDFNSSPYEIFELNSKKDKELYLFYNNEFYGLKQGQTKVTALQLIKDSEKLNALNALRSK
jgi:hypothetical protein